MCTDPVYRCSDIGKPVAVRPLHTGCASRRARLRTRSLMKRRVTASTGTPRASAASCSNPIRSSSVRSGSSSTRRSTSLPVRSVRRATDPNTRTFRTPCRRAIWFRRPRDCRRRARRLRGGADRRGGSFDRAASSRELPHATRSRSSVLSDGVEPPDSYRATAGWDVLARRASSV